MSDEIGKFHHSELERKASGKNDKILFSDPYFWTKLRNMSQVSNFLQVGRAHELRNCSTFLTSFSELNLLRGERREQEKRRWEGDKNDKGSTEEEFQGVRLIFENLSQCSALWL